MPYIDLNLLNIDDRRNRCVKSKIMVGTFVSTIILSLQF